MGSFAMNKMMDSFAAASAILGAAVFLLLLNHQVEGNVIGFGACPTVTLPAITADPFLAAGSNWFEVRRLPSHTENKLKCVRYAFGAAPAGTPVTHSVTITGARVITSKSVTITGTVTQSAAGAAAANPLFNQWVANFQSSTTGFNLFPSPFPRLYSVLGVDPVAGAWIVLYSCTTVGILNIKTSVILSTTATLTATQLAAALSAASQAGIPIDRYIAIDQTSC